jgi:hypothetical protein
LRGELPSCAWPRRSAQGCSLIQRWLSCQASKSRRRPARESSDSARLLPQTRPGLTSYEGEGCSCTCLVSRAAARPVGPDRRTLGAAGAVACMHAAAAPRGGMRAQPFSVSYKGSALVPFGLTTSSLSLHRLSSPASHGRPSYPYEQYLCHSHPRASLRPRIARPQRGRRRRRRLFTRPRLGLADDPCPRRLLRRPSSGQDDC